MYCSKCGLPLPDNVPACPSCGHPVRGAAVPPPSLSGVLGEVPSNYCSNCGRPLPPGTVVCPSCAHPVTGSANANSAPLAPQYGVPVIYCTVCGQPIYPNTKVCPRCGHVIGAAPDKPPRRWLGVCAIIFGIFPPGLLGLIFGVIGLCVSKDETTRSLCRVGIGLLFGWILLGVLPLILVFCGSLASV